MPFRRIADNNIRGQTSNHHRITRSWALGISLRSQQLGIYRVKTPDIGLFKPAVDFPLSTMPRTVDLFLFQLNFNAQGFTHLRMQNNLDGMFTYILDGAMGHADLGPLDRDTQLCETIDHVERRH